MKVCMVKIGKSRGVRLPESVIEEAGLEDVVELQVREGAVIIRPVRTPRSGWEEAARAQRKRGEDVLLDPATPTCFDHKKWKW